MNCFININLKIDHLLVIGAILFSVLLKAQDSQFTQFYAAPMYLNPALTGETNKQRLVANYRNQYSGIAKGFQTYMASYDYNLSGFNSGIGFHVLQDKAGTGGLTLNQIGFNYAYLIKINSSMKLRFGTNLSYNQQKIDFNKLKFNDQFITGSAQSMDAANFQQNNYLDFSAGSFFSANNYWVGLSLKHMNKPTSSLTGKSSSLPVTTSFHGGYRFLLENESEDQIKQHITTAFHFKHQQKYNQLDVGLYYFYSPFSVGLWYRGLPLIKHTSSYTNSESLALLIGIDIDKYNMKIGYSYDATISSLGISNSLGSHEISLKYEIPEKIVKKTYIVIPKL